MLLLSAGRRESVIKAVSGVIKLVEEARTGLAVPAKQVAELEPVARNPDPDSVTSRLIDNPDDGPTRLRGDHRSLRDICRRVVRGAVPRVSPGASVFIDGKKAVTLRGKNIAREFQKLVDEHVESRCARR